MKKNLGMKGGIVISKAEEIAFKRYPAERGYMHDRLYQREGFVEDYYQAEKDLKLNWEDIQLIVSIDWDLYHEGFSCGKSTEEYYKEVLKQFNEERQK